MGFASRKARSSVPWPPVGPPCTCPFPCRLILAGSEGDVVPTLRCFLITMLVSFDCWWPMKLLASGVQILNQAIPA
jgi:hypothetical protein